MNYKQARKNFFSQSLTSDTDLNELIEWEAKKYILNFKKGKFTINLIRAALGGILSLPLALSILLYIYNHNTGASYIFTIIFIITLVFSVLFLLEKMDIKFFYHLNKDKIKEIVSDREKIKKYFEIEQYQELSNEEIYELNREVYEKLSFDPALIDIWRRWLSSLESIRVKDKNTLNDLFRAIENEQHIGFKIKLLKENKDYQIQEQEYDDDDDFNVKNTDKIRIININS